jgi:2-oxoglutarate ferredoxin oxidoreductase subunit alpha
LEERNLQLQAKYRRIAAAEIRAEERLTDDSEILLVAYGASARIAKGALEQARAKGLRAGLFRPITLWPFPAARLAALAARTKAVLCIEMSSGQMLEDVRLAVNGKVPVYLEGRMGGSVPEEGDVLAAIRRAIKGGP